MREINKRPQARRDINEGKILLCGDDWVTPLLVNHLDEVSTTEVRVAMHLAGTRKLWIADARPLPEAAWISEEMLNWFARWEEAARKEWQQSHRLAKVS